MYQKLHIFLVGIIVFSTIFSFVDVPKAFANKTIEVATDVLNVREEPDANSPVISKVVRGETYPVVDTKGEWLKIQINSDKAGWIASYLVSENNPTPLTQQGSNPASVQVLTDDLRVRSGPGTNFNVVGFIHRTDHVSYLDQNENWVKIRTNGVEGWVSNEFVSFQAKKQNESTDDGTSQADPLPKQTAIITTDQLNVRSEASTESNVLDSLSKGKRVDVIAQKSNWLQISYDGKTGWIHEDYAALENSNRPTNESVNNSRLSATITVSGLNVRSEPNLNGEIIDQILQGTNVTIISERNSWCEIEYANGKTGWVAGWFLEKQSSSSNQSTLNGEGNIIILDNGTNIRHEPSTTAKVVYRANEGDSFPIIGIENDWYHIELSDGTKAYVAGWIVATKGQAPTITRAGAEQYLKNKVIVIDPGHGGRDVGAIGVQGTYEKDLNLRTSRLLQDKLKAAGATVILTRQNDTFVSLPVRARTANYHRADAFISVHYDSIDDPSVTGTTTFYYKNQDQQLANYVHQSLVQLTNLRDRQVRQESFLVLRESYQPSLLLEIGYISNRGEELTILSGDFQERAATGIYQGLAQYFKEN